MCIPNFTGSTGFGVPVMDAVLGDGCGVADLADCVACARFLTALDRFFVLVGVHGNNWWGASSVQGRTVPELMELTYVNRDSLAASFAAFEPVNLKELNRFMKPNHPGRREIDTLAPCTPNAGE